MKILQHLGVLPTLIQVNRGQLLRDKEVGYVVVDNVGNLYSVIATGINTVDLSDDFRCGVGPQNREMGSNIQNGRETELRHS